jgi:hypothetical protein
MHSLLAPARGQRRKRLRATAAAVAAICLAMTVASCSDDNASTQVSTQASTQASQDPQQQDRTQQQALATSFNADPSKAGFQSAATADASPHTPPSSTARARQSASPGGASAADSVVLAPPVIHTVD